MTAALALLAALVALAAEQTPTCGLSFDPPETLVWRGRAGGGYDPLDPAERWQNARVTVRHEGPACEFWVTAEDLGQQGERRAAAAGGELRYRIADAAGRPLSEFGVAGAELVSGSFGSGPGRFTFELRILVPPGQTSPPGSYRDAPALRLFGGKAGSPDQRAMALLQLRFDVGASLEIALAGPAGAGELDLGELGDGGGGGFALRVHGNSVYRLSVRSENGGFLRHDQGIGTQIPYRLLLAGARLDLGGEIEIGGPAPGAAGRELALAVEVPPAPGATAGSYRDTLVFSVAAQ